MFDRSSRYATLPVLTGATPEGRTVSYVSRRFLPMGHTLTATAEVTMEEGDRLDLLAGRALGNPLLFWRLCDASDALNPFDLTEVAGTKVRVPTTATVTKG